jgi:hypothetical protein
MVTKSARFWYYAVGTNDLPILHLKWVAWLSLSKVVVEIIVYKQRAWVRLKTGV